MSFLFFVLGFSFVSAPGGDAFSRFVEEAHQSGRITVAQKLDILETAVKRPESLPAQWRELSKAHPITAENATAILVDVLQERARAGLKSMYRYPAELPYFLDSQTHPVRVYYDDETLRNLAQTVLTAAEHSWQTQILEWGWKAPPIETPEGRYRLYVTTSGMGGGGYTAPLGPWPDTAWDDCVSYIVIDRENDTHSVSAVVAHELNHAMQAAMDCLEPSSFWENTASYMMLAVYPGSIWYVRYFLQSFQVAPHWSVADGNQNSAYWYGGFIWPYFLSSAYAPEWNDGSYMREIWERAMQSSNFSTNEPHCLDAIDAQLRESNESSLDAAFHDFSRARFFIDDRMDPDYSVLPHADRLSPSPVLAGTITVLPEQQTITPPKSIWPKPLGVNYWILETPANFNRNMTLEVITEDDAPWHFQLVNLTGSPAVQHFDSSGQRFSFTFDPLPGGRQLLIVEHMAGPDFNPNFVPRDGTEYKMYLRSTIPLPIVTTVTPGMVYEGSEVVLNVYGANLLENCQFSFVPDQSFEILEVIGTTEVQRQLRVRIPKGVLLGEYAVVATNPDGGSFRLDNAFTVVNNPGASSSKDGCSCSHPGSSGFSGWSFWMAALAFWWLRRRRG